MKASNREVSKRNVHLMDTSGKLVTATLWGNEVCALLPVLKQRFLCDGEEIHTVVIEDGHGTETES